MQDDDTFGGNNSLGDGHETNSGRNVRLGSFDALKMADQILVVNGRRTRQERRAARDARARQKEEEEEEVVVGGEGERGDAAERGKPINIIIQFSGGFAGMLGWVVAMPFDVRKTNVQASSDLRIVGSYFMELFRIARERGPLVLYTGLIPTIARAFSTNDTLFLGVEMGKKFFDGFVWAAT